MRLDRRVRLVSAVLGAMLLAVSHQDPVHGIDCVGFPSITSYPGGTGLHAVVVVDVNGDGKLDIVAATQDGARVLLGNGNGTFGDGVNYGPAAGSVAAADLNGDGHVDLALTPAAPTQTQAAIVLLGNGDGTFGAPASFASGIAQVVIKIADVDQNGTADLVLVGGGGSPIGNRNASVLLGAGNGTFAAPATYNAGTDPMALVMADFNGDGYPDIATATADHITHVAIALNRKDGTFGPGKPYNPFGLLIGIGSIAPADFNNDGKIDLLFSHPTGILMGVGDGTFTSDGTQYDGSEPAAAGDLNGDGFADAIVSNGSDGVDVLLGNGDGTLGPPASFVIGARPGDLALGDLNGDGRPDVVSAGANAISVLINAPGSCPPPLPSAPSITSQPPSQIVFAGQSVTWSASASGIPAPTVQWQYSANSGGSWNAIAGATATSYTSAASVFDSGRQFRAIFTNAHGSATTTPAGLTVKSDVSLVGDIDGDGQSDLIVWRYHTGTWYWLTSSSGFNTTMARSRQWGNASLGDIPLVGDLDGDGKADLVVWRASTGTWYWLSSTDGYDYGGQHQRQWGNLARGDRPLLGDLDGDHRADLTVWRAATGEWFWLTSSSGYTGGDSRTWGSASQLDTPLLADTDGDGRADLVVWRPATGFWSWLTSSSAYHSSSSLQWGRQGDTPLTGDFDGDGTADFAVWRPDTGTWFWLTSSTGWAYASARSAQWGSATQ